MFKSYLLSIVTVALISCIINLMVNSSNTLKKHISFITGLILLLVIVSPIINILKNPIPPIDLTTRIPMDNDFNMYQYYRHDTMKETVQEQLRRYIVDTYEMAATVNAKVSEDGNFIEGVTVHTNANALEIRKYISQNYNIPIEKVIITGTEP